MDDGASFKLRFKVWSKGTCKSCRRRRGKSLSGTLMNFGVSRSARPANIHVQLGPYCKECGGKLRIEMDLMQKVEEIS